MVEHEDSFNDDTVRNNEVGGSEEEERKEEEHELWSCPAPSVVEGANAGSSSGQFEDAEEIIQVAEDSLLVESTRTLTISGGGTRQESCVRGLVTGVRFLQPSQEGPQVDPDSTPAPSLRCWSDQEVKQALLSLTTDAPQNVLDFRRQWPNPPTPDTRQVNRILYMLRDEGVIEQCPPNGKNKKPCWKLQSL